jgi:hypothetical protein
MKLRHLVYSYSGTGFAADASIDRRMSEELDAIVSHRQSHASAESVIGEAEAVIAEAGPRPVAEPDRDRAAPSGTADGDTDPRCAHRPVRRSRRPGTLVRVLNRSGRALGRGRSLTDSAPR